MSTKWPLEAESEVSMPFRLREGSAVAGLVAALRDESKMVRSHAARALGLIGDASAAPALAAALSDQDKNVRGEAAGALGRVGDPVAVPALIAALDDPDF